MTTTFVLIHSPLVGPATWAAVRDELVLHGRGVLAPTLTEDSSLDEPLWRQHVRTAASALAGLDNAVLVAHSGAGPLMPAIRDAAGIRPRGYIFVDAGLPSAGPRKGSGSFAKSIDDLYAAGRRFPDWTDEQLRDLIPDTARRRAILSEMRPQPPRFWEETIPVPDDWPDAMCAYLRFVPNPAYDSATAEARRRGWPVRELAGGHFHMLVDAESVADALVSLAAGFRALR